ncbi:MAG TPA: hypothetical protein VMU32_12005 [Solirubrobacteraceae bacterium]|nr:hypothetical protein [Solirubrobacteraceae bacterium]
MRAAVKNPLGERRRARRAHAPRRPPSATAPERGRATRRNHAAAVSSHDRASYACGCGLLFEAPVTTTVACPHCGAAQAW